MLNLVCAVYVGHVCIIKRPSSFVAINDNVSKRITHLVFYGDLVYKLTKVIGKANLI